MYFLALNTPVTDLTMCLGRLHVPRLLVELMELNLPLYLRALRDGGEHPHRPASRLGYQGLRRSLSSLGTMASLVFLRAWRRADRIYAALESPGLCRQSHHPAGGLCAGPGALTPWPRRWRRGQLAVLFAERGVLG